MNELNEVVWVMSVTGINEMAKINGQNYVVSLDVGGYTAAMNPQGYILLRDNTWGRSWICRRNEKLMKNDEAKLACFNHAWGVK